MFRFPCIRRPRQFPYNILRGLIFDIWFGMSLVLRFLFSGRIIGLLLRSLFCWCFLGHSNEWCRICTRLRVRCAKKIQNNLRNRSFSSINIVHPPAGRRYWIGSRPRSRCRALIHNFLGYLYLRRAPFWSWRWFSSSRWRFLNGLIFAFRGIIDWWRTLLFRITGCAPRCVLCIAFFLCGNSLCWCWFGYGLQLMLFHYCWWSLTSCWRSVCCRNCYYTVSLIRLIIGGRWFFLCIGRIFGRWPRFRRCSIIVGRVHGRDISSLFLHWLCLRLIDCRNGFGFVTDRCLFTFPPGWRTLRRCISISQTTFFAIHHILCIIFLAFRIGRRGRATATIGYLWSRRLRIRTRRIRIRSTWTTAGWRWSRTGTARLRGTYRLERE